MEWIKVSHSLPKEGSHVIVHVPGQNGTYLAYQKDGNWHDAMSPEEYMPLDLIPTHWIKLIPPVDTPEHTQLN